MSGSAARCASALVLALSLLVLGPPSRPALAQPGNQREDESEVHVQEGERRLARRQYRQAAQSFERALEFTPRALTYRRLASTYFRMQDVSRAITTLRAAHRILPDDGNVTAELGSYLLEADAGEEGLTLLRGALSGDGARDGFARDQAYLALARYWQRHGRLRGAIVALRHLQRSSPAPARSLHLARLYLRAQLPERALALLQELDAKDPVVAVELALALTTLDCGRATPVLGTLDSRDARVMLLRARCALDGGNPTAAMELVQTYQAQVGADRRVVDHGDGLLGDVYLAIGNLGQARAHYLRANERDPQTRLWVSRLARMDTRAGAPSQALTWLDSRPASPLRAGEAAWWIERGRALLALEDPAALAAFLEQLRPRLAERAEEPAEPELFSPGAGLLVDPRLWAVLGDVEAALGQYEAAERALRLGLRGTNSAPARRSLAAMLVTWSAQLIDRGDAAGAEAVLGRYESFRNGAPTMEAAASLRNLGIALLMQGRPAAAAPVLEGALTRAMSAMTAMLHGRALAAAGDPVRARAQYQLAGEAAVGVERKEVAIERARLEMASGAPEEALRLLKAEQQQAASDELEQRYHQALVTVQHAAAVARLRAGDAEGARVLLEELAGPQAEPALRCNHALAVVAARQRSAAAVVKQLGTTACSFGGTSEGLAILSATIDGQGPGNAKRALAELAAVARRAPQAKALVAAATRVVALTAADQAYRRGELVIARRFLRQAAQARTSVGEDELAHNDAVLALAESGSQLERRLVELLRLEGRVPEAAINVGVAYELLHQPQSALDAWRRVRGVRFPPLVDWIRAKAALLEGP